MSYHSNAMMAIDDNAYVNVGDLKPRTRDGVGTQHSGKNTMR